MTPRAPYRRFRDLKVTTAWRRRSLGEKRNGPSTAYRIGRRGKIMQLNRTIQAGRVKVPVNGVDPKHIREYLAGLELAGVFEVEELRRTPIELKLRQIWSLMTSADLLDDEAGRESGIAEVRDRWRRIRRAFP